MSDHRSPPPDPAACLERVRPSSRKGGTIIAEDVCDRVGHERRRRDPDGYRPPRCPGCEATVLHVHEYRGRVLRADPEGPSLTIVIYLCVECGGTWRVLPGFLARHLWRRWPVVEAHTIGPDPPATWPPVPERTRRRWRERLEASARRLVQLLATSASVLLESIAAAVGLDATRGELVVAFATMAGVPGGRRLCDVAALVDRLCPGVRLM